MDSFTYMLLLLSAGGFGMGIGAQRYVRVLKKKIEQLEKRIGKLEDT